MSIDSWKGGKLYDDFMGRWSLLIGGEFLSWLKVPPNSEWLDVGCGTGSLSKLIIETQQPNRIIALDSSSGFISYAKKSIDNPLVNYIVGSAMNIELNKDSVDTIVSAFTLNFLSRPHKAVREMKRVGKPGGVIGIMLWDYTEGMEMLRYYWDAALTIDKRAEALDEGRRFPICRQGNPEIFMQKMGLRNIEATAIEIKTTFKSFDEYWEPFLGNVGPAPEYNMSLSTAVRKQLKENLIKALPIDEDGSIRLIARAWAVKGIV